MSPLSSQQHSQPLTDHVPRQALRVLTEQAEIPRHLEQQPKEPRLIRVVEIEQPSRPARGHEERLPRRARREPFLDAALIHPITRGRGEFEIEDQGGHGRRVERQDEEAEIGRADAERHGDGVVLSSASRVLGVNLLNNFRGPSCRYE